MSEKERINKQLHDELNQIKFTKHENVLQRTQPITFKQRVFTWWNKEVEISLLPIAGVCVLLFTIIGAKDIIRNNDEPSNSENQKELIEIGNNVYWKDALVKKGVYDEN